MEIPKHIKDEISKGEKEYCKKHGKKSTGYYAINFGHGAEFGYSLSQKEIEDVWFKIKIAEKRCDIMNEMLLAKDKEIDELREENRKLKDGLKQAIDTIDMECDSLEYVTELRKLLNP